jgi:glycosyltransferase involved in cell wall biosynthesis
MIVSTESSDLEDIFARADAMAAAASKAFVARPRAVIHCFEWFGGAFGLAAHKKSKTPFVLTLTSIESERSAGNMHTRISQEIVAREGRALEQAARVIVPTDNLRDRIAKEYGIAQQKIAVSALPSDQEQHAPSIGDIKRGLGLGPGPMVLFAGEIGWNDGADLFIDAAITVASKRHDTHFVLAGAGPMRPGLEQRARGAGHGGRIHFWGDVSGDTFEKLLLSSDFVVIPARTARPASLAENAIAHGRPVLTTHGARLAAVRHGQNGLISYDNPGSIVWGISELLANPLSSNMMRGLAKQHARVGNTQDCQCIQYWIAACLARTDHA